MKKLIVHFVIALLLFYPAHAENIMIPGNLVLSVYQRDVINYFKEIALGFEYGTASQVTRKWTTNMKIFVGGSPSAVLTHELDLVVAELNMLITDEFEIEIVNDRKLSNYYIYFGSSSQYANEFPVDSGLAQANSGAFRIYWNNSNNRITKGRMFVDSNTNITEQRSVLREELTQSLGLGKDSPLYHESIFQSDYTTPTEFAEIDKDIIRLLYHPQMIIGLSSSEVETLLTEILLSEKSASIADGPEYITYR